MKYLIILILLMLSSLSCKGQAPKRDSVIENLRSNQAILYDSLTQYPGDTVNVDYDIIVYKDTSDVTLMILTNKENKVKDTFFIKDLYDEMTINNMVAYFYTALSTDNREYMVSSVYTASSGCIKIGLSDYRKMIAFLIKREVENKTL